MSTDHATYAPSSAERWLHCTASPLAIAQLGARDSNEEADAGTFAHEEIDRVLGGLTRIEQGDKLKAYCVEMADPDHPAAYGVALVFDYVSQLGPGDLWVEQRVHLTAEIWGRCDIAHWCERTATLTIVDYKNGFVDVQPNSPQFKIYAGGVIYGNQLPVKWVRFVVVQPNSIVPGPRVKQLVVSAEQLHADLSVIAGIPSAPPKFVAGTHCRYCPVFGMCPATQDLLLHLSAALARPATEVPANQIAALLACKKPLDNWWKALESHGLKQAVAGNVPPEMKLVTGVKRRAWKNEAEVRRMIFERFGFEALDAPTPAQAEEKLGLDVSELADKPAGAPVLAFKDDARAPYVKPDVKEMFATVVKELAK